MPLVFASLPFLFGICLHLFAYRELGFRAGTALLPEWGDGKDKHNILYKSQNMKGGRENADPDLPTVRPDV